MAHLKRYSLFFLLSCSWIFAISFPVNGENGTLLTIAVLLPLSSPDLDGRPYLPALDLALELINNRSDILSGYTLQAVVNDSACSAGPSVRSFIHQIFNPPIKVGMIGPICSTATQPVAELASYWNLVLISAGASNPKLSDTTEYPTFLRSVSSDTSVVEGIIALMKFYGWSRIASITQQEFLFTATSSELSEAISSNNLSESRNFQFGSNDNPQAQVEKLYAQELGMTTENGYVWLTYDWYGSEWWTRGPVFQTNYEPFNCSIAKRRSFVQGIFSIDHFAFVEEENYNDETDLGISLSQYYSMYYERLNRDYGHISDLGLFTVYFTPLFVDAIWTLALALNASENQLSNVDGSPKSLLDFNYESSEFAALIHNEATKVKFLGSTGDVSYESNGDRVGYVRYFQYRQNSESGSIEGELIGRIIDDEVVLEPGESEKSLFPRGQIPTDKTNDYIDSWIFITCTICVCIGILYALGCLVFNIVFSKKKLIKLSSPYLNILIVLGALMIYVDIILLGLDKALISYSALNDLCIARVWIGVLAFTLLFGTMFAKTWRVYYIFHASDKRKQTKKLVVHDGFLLLMIIILLLIDFMFLIPVTVVPSARLELKYKELHSSNHELPIEICVCTASHRFIWIGILFAYKGILLIAGLFLAFETRNVKIRQLNDSHLIGMCVYATVVLSIALAPIGALLEIHVDVHYAIIGSMTMFGITLILSLLFIPKVYSLIKDPSGEIAMSGALSTSNNVETKNGTEYLRQEVEKLRIQLAKNRKMSAAEISLSPLSPNGPKSYTISEIAGIPNQRNRSVSLGGNSLSLSPNSQFPLPQFDNSTNSTQYSETPSTNGFGQGYHNALETIVSGNSQND